MTTAPPTSRELTIIVPTYNEALALPALLESLASLADVDFEVIVSDGGSTDATCEVAPDTPPEPELPPDIGPDVRPDVEDEAVPE